MVQWIRSTTCLLWGPGYDFRSNQGTIPGYDSWVDSRVWFPDEPMIPGRTWVQFPVEHGYDSGSNRVWFPVEPGYSSRSNPGVIPSWTQVWFLVEPGYDSLVDSRSNLGTILVEPVYNSRSNLGTIPGWTWVWFWVEPGYDSPVDSRSNLGTIPGYDSWSNLGTIPGRTRVRFPVEPRYDFRSNLGTILVEYVPHVKQIATLCDSVGFLPGLHFPPTLHHNSPNIVHWADNVLVDAQLSTQKKKRGNKWLAQGYNVSVESVPE
jgi:hypothetical protein